MSEAPREGQEAPKNRQIKLVKKIVPYEESSPETEPLFANYVKVAQAAGIYYIDLGVVALDDILKPSDQATFMVLSRVVMRQYTLTQLRDLIVGILNSNSGEHIDVAPIIS